MTPLRRIAAPLALLLGVIGCGGRELAVRPATIAKLAAPARPVPMLPVASPSAAESDAPDEADRIPPASLVWVPGGLPPGLGAQLASLSGVQDTVVVAGNTAWMTRSLDADGRVVDHPRAPYMIPIETFAASPRAMAPFLPRPVRSATVEVLERGDGVLSATAARLRRLGRGGTLEFEGGARVRIGMVVPDAVASWGELLVSSKIGVRLDVTDERFALLRTSGEPTAGRLADRIRPYVPDGDPLEVRAPGAVRFRRHADLVLPYSLMKVHFGEFAARPDPALSGYLQLDPSYVREHLDTRVVPLLGRVVCNVALFPPLIAAMRELRMHGLAGLIQGFAGCYSPRTVLRAPSASISHHSWGAAVDINAAQNPFGATPVQDRRLVRTMARHGFAWGGVWIIPDGHHFDLDPWGARSRWYSGS